MDKPQISPFQLFCLLFSGRLFTLLLWSPQSPQPGAILLVAAVGPVLQLGLALLLCWFFRELVWGKQSPGRLGGWAQKLALAVCWAGCLVIAALTAGSVARFLSRAFYGGSYGLLAVVLLLAAAAVAAWLGLEATARMGALLLAAALAGLGLLLAGSVGQGHLAYLPAPYADLPGTARLLAYSCFTNWELLLLPLLTPHCTKPMKKRAIAVWLGLCGGIQAALAVLAMAVLGYYGAGQSWPVYALARCARLALAERMDALLMGVWVLLGFLRCTVALWLAGDLWGRLRKPSTRLWRPALHGLAACLAALLVLSGCSPRQTIGQKTIATMVELDYTGGRCRLRVEYRQPGAKDQPTRYGVYEGEGDTPQQALAALEQQHSLTLWLESCRVVAVAQPHGSSYDHQTLAWLLEQLAVWADLRPLTSLVLAEGPVLKVATPEEKGETSTATQLLSLFDGRGGVLSGRFTLKDAVAQSRDPLLPLLLPTVAAEEDSPPALTGFLAMEEGQQGRLTVAEAQLLPLQALAGSQPVETLAGTRLRSVYSLWLPAGEAPTLWLFPVGNVDSREQETAKTQLSQTCQAAAQALLEKMQSDSFPDLLGLQKQALLENPKFWQNQGQTMPPLTEADRVKIVVKPLVSLH